MPTNEELLRLRRERSGATEPAPLPADQELLNLRNQRLQREVPAEPVSTHQDDAVETLITIDNNQTEFAPSETIKSLRRSANGVFANQPEKDAQVADYVEQLKAVGINAEFALDPVYGPKVQAEAAVAAQRFLERTEVGGLRLLDVQGEGVEEDKGRLLNAFTVASLVRNAPLVGSTARKVHAASIRNAVQQQIDRVFSQVQPGQPNPEAQQLAALAQVVARADDNTLFKVGQFAGYIDPTDPISPTQEIRQEIPNTLAESSPLFRSMFELVARTGIESEAARIREGVNDLGQAPSSKRAQDVAAATAAILGDTWTEQIRNATQRGRINFNLGQLGIDPASGGPGYSEDGLAFVPVLAGDAIRNLSVQAAASLEKRGSSAPLSLSRVEKTEIQRIIEQDKPAKDILDEAEKLGPQNRTKVARELIATDVEQRARLLARAEAFGMEEVDPGLTPFEKEYMGTMNTALFQLLDQSQRFFGSFSRALKRQDVETNRAFEKLTGAALDKNFTYALTNSEQLTDATEGFFGAWAASARMNRERGELAGGLSRWFNVASRLMSADPNSTVAQNPRLAELLPGSDLGSVRVGVLQNHPMFRGLSSEAAAALQMEDVDVMKLHGQQREFAKKSRDEIMGRMMEWQRNGREGRPQTQSWLGHVGDALRLTGHMAGDFVYEMSRIVSENPEEAAAMLMIEAPVGKGALATRKFLTDKADIVAGRALGGQRLSQIYNAGKVNQALQRLQHSNPVMARRFQERLQDMSSKAADAGDIAEHVDAMAAAATAAKRAADEADLTGGVVSSRNLKNMGKKIADVWQDLLEEPGDVQRWIDHVTASTRGGLFKDLVRLGRRVFGDGKGGSIRDQVFDQRSFDEALEGLDQMISTGTEVENFYSAMVDLADQSGRAVNELTPAEVAPLLPKQINDVIALVDQAHKIPVKEGLMERLSNGLTRLRGASMADRLVDFKESVTEAVNMVAARAIDSGVQKAGWGVTRKRLDRVMKQVQARREAELLQLDDEFAKAMDDLVNTASTQGTSREAISAVEAEFDKKIAAKRDEIKAGKELIKRISEHDADLSFDGRDLPTLGSLTDNDIEMLMAEAPELFDLTPDDVFTYRTKGKGKKRDIDRINTRLSTKEKQVEKARAGLNEQVTEGDVTRPPNEAELKARRAGLAKLEAQLQTLRQKADVIKNGRRERVAVNRRVFFDALSHRGLTPDAKARKDNLTDLRNTVATGRAMELGSNPFLPGHLPLRQALRWAKQGIETVSGKMQSRVSRMQQYMTQYDLMSPDERQFMDQLLKRAKGQGLTAKQFRAAAADILNTYPKLRSVFDDPKDVRLLREFATEIDDNLAGLYTLMDDLGVDKGVIQSWRDKGYDHNIYGIFERESLITGPQRADLLKTPDEAAGKPQEPLLTATGQSLKFQRRFRDWRVVIDTPAGRQEFNFPTSGRTARQPSALKQFLRRRYGKTLKQQPAGEGVWTSELPTGDRVTIGAPIGNLGVNILDPIGSRGERLLLGISRAYRDIGVQHLFQALNLNGNLVLDADQFAELLKKQGNKLNRTYEVIPDNKALFGNMAGKYIHRRLLSDINAASRGYNALDQVLRGMREILHREGAESGIFDTLLGKTPGAFGQVVETLTGVMKQNLILLSQRVWFGNQLFNIMLDVASGADLYTSREGIKSLFWAWQQRFRGQAGGILPRRLSPKAAPGAVGRDPITQEAIEGGILDGFFEPSGGPNAEARLLARMVGFEELDKLTARLANREALVAKLQREGLANPNSKANIVKLQKDISALEIQIDELQRGWLKNLGRNTAALFTDQGVLQRVAQDTVGRRGGSFQHRLWDILRDMYNNVDSTHKLATYHHLRVTKGYSKLEALQHVKDFAQNYRDIPQWLRPTGGKGALLSLVTSFPYEAARLFGNLITKRPQRFAAILGMMPMLNMAMLTQAGIDKEQFLALMETRGAKTKTDALLSLTDTLFIPGPGGSLATSIDMGLVQPYTNLVSNDFSPVARFVSQFHEEDSEVGMLAQVPARFVGNFLLNNPVFGGSMSAVGAIDLATGAPIWDDRMTADQKALSVVQRVTQAIVPPWAPGSRAFNDYDASETAPINPRTGRPLGAKQRGTVETQLAGFAVKGRGASTMAKILDPVTLGPLGGNPTGFDDPQPIDFANSENVLVSLVRQAGEKDVSDRRSRPSKFPVHSKDSELRQWILMKAQSDDPEIREQAQTEIDAIIEKNYERLWKPLGEKRTLTDRERAMLEEFIKDYTVEAQMGRLDLDQQAEVLVRMDQLGLFSDRRLADMIQQVEFSPLGGRKVTSDPGKVRQAIELLDKHLESPGANPRLKDLRGYLAGRLLPKAEALFRRDQRRRELKQERQRRAADVRFRP